jgi:hypothetical protein
MIRNTITVLIYCRYRLLDLTLYTLKSDLFLNWVMKMHRLHKIMFHPLQKPCTPFAVECLKHACILRCHIQIHKQQHYNFIGKYWKAVGASRLYIGPNNAYVRIHILRRTFRYHDQNSLRSAPITEGKTVWLKKKKIIWQDVNLVKEQKLSVLFTLSFQRLYLYVEVVDFKNETVNSRSVFITSYLYFVVSISLEQTELKQVYN